MNSNSTLGAAALKADYAQAVDVSFFDQLSAKLERLSSTLTDADGSLTMVSDRLFGSGNASNSQGPQNNPPISGRAEGIFVALDILQMQAVTVANRSQALNSRL